MSLKMYLSPIAAMVMLFGASTAYAIENNGKTPIGSVTLEDPKLDQCLQNIAMQNGWKITEQVLELFCTGPDSLGGIEVLNQLQTVGINIGGISDLTPLKSAKNLNYLMLEDEKIENLTPLKGLNKLEYLNLGGNLTLKDVSPLGGLHALKKLYLFEASIEDISALTNLDQLTILHLSFNRIRTVGQLGQLTHLEELHLFNGFAPNADSDALVLPIGKLKNLKRLSLAANRISDLSVLKNLDQLDGADFGFNLLSDLAFLQNKPLLKAVYLDGNRIKTWDYLTTLPALESLYLQDNGLTEIPNKVIQAFVQNMPHLERINLAGNPIKCADVEKLIAALPNATVIAPEHCSIEQKRQDFIREMR